jgi:hypothetical protein
MACWDTQLEVLTLRPSFMEADLREVDKVDSIFSLEYSQSLTDSSFVH